jgi:signal transduction histidine kinase
MAVPSLRRDAPVGAAEPRDAVALPRPLAASERAATKAPPRRAFGIVFIGAVMLLQVSTDLIAGRGVWGRMTFLAALMPILMLALSATFGWSVRRHVSAPQALAAGVAIAGTIGCVFGVLHGIVAMHVPFLRLHFPNGVSFSRSALFGLMNAQLYFGAWALAFVYPFAVESAGVRALEAQHLRTQTELARLRSHLEPHFLLNTLNAIAGLVTDDPREARRLIVCLGDLLRDAVLDNGEVQRLDEQVAWLRRYAQILEARHHGALRFRWEVAPDCEGALLPRLLLQPLVENAVKHGALRRGDGAGEVVVSARRTPAGTLHCVVEDNGPGMNDADIRAGAFGLQAVRRRLELEAPDAALRLESSSGGLRCTIELAAGRA